MTVMRYSVTLGRMKGIQLPKLVCARCGYEWHPRKAEWPKRCPARKCGSPYWETKAKPKRGK